MENMEMERAKIIRVSTLLRLQQKFMGTRFCSFFIKIMSWILYYICFCKTAVFVSGLVFSYKLVDYAVLRILITYFSNVSFHGFNLKTSAILTDIQEGLSATFLLVATWKSYNSPTLPLKIMICSTLSCTIGLFVLYTTTVHKFSVSILYLLNVIGIILLAVGVAGLKPLLGAFLTVQIRHHHEQEGNQNEDQIKTQKRVWWRLAWCCSVGVAFILNYKSWRATFIWTGIAMVISFILFLLGYLSYNSRLDSLSFHRQELTFDGSPFIIFRVIKASLLKKQLNYPLSPDLYHDNDEDKSFITPRIKFLRWLDKAAVIESSSSLDPQQQQNAGTLCTVPQVRESKLLLKLFPMWASFLVFGLVLSAGCTFFPQQGTDTDSNGYLIFFPLFTSISCEIISYLLNLLISKWVPTNKRRQAQIVSIWMGMAISVFCFIVAWRVEVHHRSTETILWLVPQFCLLGLMAGFAMNGLDKYVSYCFPEWMEDHVSLINEFVIGIGSYLHIFFVLANKSLFARALNDRRLDKYYMRLMIVSVVNVCYNSCLSILYIKSDQNARVDDRLQTTNADAN